MEQNSYNSKLWFGFLLEIMIQWNTVNIFWVLTICQLLFCGTKLKKRMQFLPSRNLDPNSIVKAKFFIAAAAAKSLQSCPTLCDPIDGSPSGSSVPGILQARTLEWVAISFSNAWKWKVKVKLLSHVWLLATPWTAAYQAPLSMEFARQEYWSGLPLPSPFIATRFLKCFVAGSH